MTSSETAVASEGAIPAANTLMDNFEHAFQDCLSILIKEDNFNTQDRETVRAHAENAVTQFMECARRLEHSFLQKRLLLSVHRPDWLIKEDTQELKLELNRKDELIKKNQEKIGMWKTLLADPQHTQWPYQQLGAALAAPSSLDMQRMSAGAGIQQQMSAAMMYRHKLTPPTPQLGATSAHANFPAGTAAVMNRGGSGAVFLQQQQQQAGGAASHLACLEKTTSNIGAQNGAVGGR